METRSATALSLASASARMASRQRTIADEGPDRDDATLARRKQALAYRREELDLMQREQALWSQSDARMKLVNLAESVTALRQALNIPDTPEGQKRVDEQVALWRAAAGWDGATPTHNLSFLIEVSNGGGYAFEIPFPLPPGGVDGVAPPYLEVFDAEERAEMMSRAHVVHYMARCHLRR